MCWLETILSMCIGFVYKLRRWIYHQYANLSGVNVRQIAQTKLKDIAILYRSDNFVVVNKTFDVRINSDDPDHTVTVETQLRQKFPNLVAQKCAHGFRFVHRLDHATSGALCIALNKKAARWATAAIMNKQLTKHYLALLRGHLDPVEYQKKEISISIGRDRSELYVHKMCTVNNINCQNPVDAFTTVVLLEHGLYDGQPASKVLLIPCTGRTHQLRVHCAYIGHKIVGDYTYSNRTDVKPYRMMLHAHHMTIPMVQEHINVTAPDTFLSKLDPLWKPYRTFNTYVEYLNMNPIETNINPQTNKQRPMKNKRQGLHSSEGKINSRKYTQEDIEVINSVGNGGDKLVELASAVGV